MPSTEPVLQRQYVDIPSSLMMADTRRAVSQAVAAAGMRDGDGWEMVGPSGNEHGMFRLYFERRFTPRPRSILNRRASRGTNKRSRPAWQRSN